MTGPRMKSGIISGQTTFHITPSTTGGTGVWAACRAAKPDVGAGMNERGDGLGTINRSVECTPFRRRGLDFIEVSRIDSTPGSIEGKDDR